MVCMKNRVENINCTFLNCSPLFNHPSIVTRSQGYYQDQFVMFAVLESAKPSGGEWINCCIENVTMRPERVLVLHHISYSGWSHVKLKAFFSNSKIVIFFKNKIVALLFFRHQIRIESFERRGQGWNIFYYVTGYTN